ncbi:MAG TPA: DUF58 domain-containing protein [Gallionellaceae bacterium]|nr:DUF58 domain-containing protein [Gallionellaceae bacterium]
MRASLQQRFSAWARARQTRHEGTVTLTQRSVYIIPTRRGFAFAGALVVMLLGDINYVLGLGYVLTFLLASMGLMSMLHAVRNMLRLEIRAGRTEPVFTGDMAEFRFHLHNPRPLARHGLHLRDEHGHHTEFDLPANQTLEVGLPVPATQRGWLATGRLTLYTEFPLGLFYAWSYIYFDTRVLVYPRPAPAARLPAAGGPSGSGTVNVAGDEDFTGLRSYAAGDTPQRIAWKALAREQGLQVKQFNAVQGNELWLDWLHAPSEDPEQKLAILARWILDAEARGLTYGLRLPGLELRPASGMAQHDDCLRAIALFGLEAT